ncbi:hypothetical protein CC2G_014908 [Coprinopsis cinerea AmutBmut pab1-1]|nr:hypothetical protein CC2G_014908 [Coprinopsis cinerea AmutBmut pab1-1]
MTIICKLYIFVASVIIGHPSLDDHPHSLDESKIALQCVHTSFSLQVTLSTTGFLSYPTFGILALFIVTPRFP